MTISIKLCINVNTQTFSHINFLSINVVSRYCVIFGNILFTNYHKVSLVNMKGSFIYRKPLILFTKFISDHFTHLLNIVTKYNKICVKCK